MFGQEQDPCYSINDYNETTSSSNPPITLDLLSGWNMMGFSCVNEGDAHAILSPISDKISLAKNNAGSVYMPEFGFNGIGSLIPNQGYQIKMNETVLGFEMCTNPIPFYQVEGCTDCEAANFNQWANVDDGICEYNNCTDPSADNFGEILPCLFYGCNDPLAANYDPYANTDDGSCVVAEACPYENYLEYSPDAISYNESLCINIIVEGCTDNTALNYNPQANLEDESCEFIYGCIDQDANNYNLEATTDDGLCIYYGCTDTSAGNYDETANTDDGTCLIGGCMNATADNYNPEASIDDASCIIYGCTLSSFPNYNSVATIGDGSCDMSSTDVFGCIDESTWTYQDIATIDNGLCNYSELEVGALGLGGIVFYIDETGEHGLVASLEDLGSYQWGCYGQSVSGADGTAIGTGYQNTLDIVSQNCQTQNGGITAAQATLNASTEGYTDWYLPSFDELYEMYNTIGNGGPEGNIGGFSNNNYWSSSENNNDFDFAWFVYFNNGYSNIVDKNATIRVRVIRAF